MNRFTATWGFGSQFILPLILCFSGVLSGGPARSEDVHLVTTGTMSADTEIFWHETLQSGWLESRRSGRPMIIFITSDRCTYCDAMKQSTWCEPSIRYRVLDNFVAIRLKRGRNDQSLDRIDVPVFPMTLIGTPAGKVVGHRLGYQPPASVHGLMSEASAPVRTPR